MGLLMSCQRLVATRVGSMEAKQRITKSLITALAAKEGDGSIIWDTDVTGFGVRLGHTSLHFYGNATSQILTQRHLRRKLLLSGQFSRLVSPQKP